METLGAVSICYVIGSIPFGFALTKFFLNKDIRFEGSGNIGATNVLRTSGCYLGMLTLLLDCAKGTCGAFFAHKMGVLQLGCFAVFIGHLFPAWLKFKGGKGVATYAGILLYLNWIATIIGLLSWLSVFALTRISSLSALISSIAIPFWMMLYGSDSLNVLTIMMSTLVVIRHRKNINRLIRGEEKKF